MQINLPPFPVYRLGQRLTVQCTPQSFAPAQRWRQWSRGVQARCFNAIIIRTAQASQSGRLSTRARSKPLSSSLFIARSMNRKHHYWLGLSWVTKTGMPVELTKLFSHRTTHIVALSALMDHHV